MSQIKIKRYLICFIVILTLLYPPYAEYSYSLEPELPVEYQYKFFVIDTKGNPIEVATIEYMIYLESRLNFKGEVEEGKIYRKDTFITKSDGKMVGTIENISRDSKIRYKVTIDNILSSLPNKPATVNRLQASLSHMFTKAFEWEMISEDILKRVRKANFCLRITGV